MEYRRDAEFKNHGLGASTSGCVKWPGVMILTKYDAIKYTPAKFYDIGDAWIKHLEFCIFSTEKTKRKSKRRKRRRKRERIVFDLIPELTALQDPPLRTYW
ncbi:hypothetical protein GOBAR_AA40398 [Gossypium barbadense]|uniref:Uncharacterized protein n=1 Tax=Gossypium barbadense TaxID=3634 RepID=A0A2P5VN88_GOSBA|nr:hypothetical protein GOBAR_AA40398 [Gossypium barbadense]